MDFELSEDQKLLADTVGQFTKQEATIERSRSLWNGDVGWDPQTWRKMGELGWLSVPFPESVGGFGGSFVEVALVLERLAGTLVPEPYLASVVLGGLSVLRGGTPDQRSRFLTPMIEGQTSLALAYAEPGSRHDPRAIQTRATATGASFVLSGEKAWVLNGHAADHLIVSARIDDGIGLFVIDRESDNLKVQRLHTIDGRPAAHIRLDGVEVAADRHLSAADGAEVLDRVLDYGAAAACAEGAGVTEAVLRMTVGYLKERQQFGVPIGSFQALQHRCVDMFIEAQLCKSMMYLAAVRADEDDTSHRALDISAAKVQLDWGGQYVTRQAIQLYGGVGITEEYDVGLYFKRMGALAALFGDEARHVERFASHPGFEEL